MSIYYFEDKKGTFFSEDGKRKFIMLTGEAAYQYMKDHRPNGVYFIQTVTDETGGDKVFVEVPKSSVSVVRKENYHGQYLSKMKKKSNYIHFSFDEAGEDDNDEAETVFDDLIDNGHTVEDAVIHEIELEMLRRGLKTLTDDELRIIHALFLSDNPVSERELAKEMGFSQPYIHKLKGRILEKLRKYF